MTPDQYVNSVVQKHRLPEVLDSYTTLYVVSPLKQIISNWAGVCLCEIKLSGSRAKGTAIDLSTDLDLFISLSSTTQNSLKEIYESLYNRMVKEGITVRKQNVSIGVTYQGKKVDLVPAKRQGQYGNDHSLYKRKVDSWTKTNIDTHISRVRQSGSITDAFFAGFFHGKYKPYLIISLKMFFEIPTPFLSISRVKQFQNITT